MTATGALVVAIALFFLPGFLLAWVSGAKAPAAAAAALPVTFGIVGASSWAWGVTSAPYNLVTFTISVLFFLALAALWRWVTDKRLRTKSAPWRDKFLPHGWRRGGVFDPSWVLPAAGVAVGALMFISDRLRWLARAPHGLGNIVQGWDVQWHANMVRFIMDEGIASPTRMGELRNIADQAHLFYPSGFHAGTALFGEAAGLDPIPALNIAAAVLPGLALPLSLACLVFASLQSRGLTAQIAAGLAAIASYGVPTLMWIPDYVGMWPYLVAVSMTGIVIWQFCAVPAQRSTALPAALGFVGVMAVHPSSATIVVLAVALFWLTRVLFVPVTTRVADTAWLALPGLAGALLFLPQALGSSEQAEEVAATAPPEMDVTDAGGWATVLLMRTRHVDQFFPDFDPAVLLWLAGLGAVALVVWRRQVWPLLFFGASALVAVHVLEPFNGWLGDALGAVSSLHYNTAHRLVMPVSMMTVVAAAIGLAVAIRVLTLAPLATRKDSPRWLRATAAASVAVALVTGAGTAWWAKESAHDGARASYLAPRLDSRMVNDNDLAAFDWLASQPAAREGLTIGEPADGYSWAYAYNGLPTVARHYLGPSGGRGSDGEILHHDAQMLGAGVRGDADAENAVDQAARDLDVRFILSSPGNFWAQQLPPYSLLKGLWTSPGVTPVYRKGDTVIFAVNAAFTRSEIYQLERDAQDAGSDPIPVPRSAASSGALL